MLTVPNGEYRDALRKAEGETESGCRQDEQGCEEEARAGLSPGIETPPEHDRWHEDSESPEAYSDGFPIKAENGVKLGTEQWQEWPDQH
jgi:hypothetical protein